MSTSSGSSSKANGLEHYTIDHRSAFGSCMADRTAQANAAFFLPHLREGTKLLDCGCGSGSITIGFAKAVTGISVVGVDLQESEIHAAEERAKTESIGNVRFELGDVYNLQYSEGSFDAVYCHAVLDHLSRPIVALREMHRVLRYGGVIGVRACDWGGWIHWPQNSLVDEAFSLWHRYKQHEGGDPFIGRRLCALIREAGFERVAGSAAPAVATTSAEVFKAVLLAPRLVEDVISLGWATKEKYEEMSRAIDEWCTHPDFFHASPWVEATAWKRSRPELK